MMSTPGYTPLLYGWWSVVGNCDAFQAEDWGLNPTLGSAAHLGQDS